MKRNNLFLYLFFFIIPISFLGGVSIFYLLRLFIVVYGAFLLLFYGCLRPIVKDAFLAIMLLLLTLYCILQHKLSPFISVIIIWELYVLYSARKINTEVKERSFSFLLYGSLFSGIAGTLYMFVSGKWIVGGDFVENSLGISNLSTPLSFSFFVVGDAIKKLKKKKVLDVNYVLYFVVFLIILYLGKRGPILFSAISIFVALLIYNINLKRCLLVFLFLYPIYELPLIAYIIDNYQDSLGEIFERTDDFNDIDNNPRILRLQAASVFLTDFRPRDIIGYHEEIIMTKSATDVDHNHFHNMLLQLYYERGLLSVLCILVFLLLYREKNAISTHHQCAIGLLSFLLMIGTNESLLHAGSLGEMLFFNTYLYHKYINVK